MPDYLQNIIHQDKDVVSYYFSVTSFTAPIGGVVIAGIIMQKFGGYQNPKAQKLLVIMGWCGCACSLAVPFVSDFTIVAALFWGLLFFGGFILPSTTGLMIASVGAFQRSQANSIANLFYNLFGYLPAPVLYGTISKALPKTRWAMGFLMFSVFPSSLFLTLGIMWNLAKNNNIKDQRVTSYAIPGHSNSFCSQEDDEAYQSPSDSQRKKHED